MSKVLEAKILEKKYIQENIIKFSLDVGQIAQGVKPGQFIEIQISDNHTDPFLRRPISIHNVEKDKGILDIIFRIQGRGTDILAKKEQGEKINILGPLGFGTFKYDGYNKIAVVGGGIGVFPLYELAKNAKNNMEVNTYLGYRSSNLVMLEEEFKKVSSKLVIATSDGSYGVKGYATDILLEDLKKGDIDCIFSCGPTVMLRSLKEIAEKNNIDCQLSLEEKMGCGFGVCLGCAVKPSEGSYYLHVCKQGPVFDAKKVII